MLLYCVSRDLMQFMAYVLEGKGCTRVLPSGNPFRTNVLMHQCTNVLMYLGADITVDPAVIMGH